MDVSGHDHTKHACLCQSKAKYDACEQRMYTEDRL